MPAPEFSGSTRLLAVGLCTSRSASCELFSVPRSSPGPKLADTPLIATPWCNRWMENFKPDVHGSPEASADRSPRRILISVTGLSPQVVTETLYALWREGGADALPTEVHVLTTTEGRERVRLALLSDSPGWFHRLRADYGMPPIRFDESQVHVLCHADGRPMQDIRTEADNSSAADAISAFIQDMTRDEDASLHVSIAGGRKTLGFFAGYALGLWGRTQDRMSHVLVSHPFESLWDFFYPTPYQQIIHTREGRIADSSTAQVTLADIPFVRLRHGLPVKLLQGKATFAQAVAAAQGHVGPAELVIDLRAGRIRAAGRVVPVPPADLAFLAWFARRAQQRQAPLLCPPDGLPDKEYADALLAEYRRAAGALFDDESRTVRRYRNGMSKQDFEQGKSSLKAALHEALGAASKPYEIQSQGRRPMRYHLALEPQAIRFDQLPAPTVVAT